MTYLLSIMNQYSEMKPLLVRFVQEVKKITGCEAVGIRVLTEEGTIPYETYTGFKRDFCRRAGPLSIDSDRCSCSNVFREEYDRKLPCYTQEGSFYVNYMSRYLPGLSEAERKTCDFCDIFHYESVALIPIRVQDRVSGLIHLADRKEDRVPLDLVELIESIALHLGTAIQRVWILEDLKAAERNLEEKVREKTEQLQQRWQQLIQANKLSSLGVLVAGVAHEINNPNQIILANIDLLEEAWRGVSPFLDEYCEQNGDFLIAGVNYSDFREELSANLARSLAAARRIDGIVGDLKEFSRKEPDRVESDVDINLVIQGGVTLMSNYIKTATGNFRLELSADIPPVRGSFQKLEQVLVNLLENACQALTSRKQGILVRSSLRQNQVEISVQDEGRGIAAVDLARLGDPFFTTKRDSGGTGLGLSVSSTIVREHGGRLEFSSQKGEGTTATLFLPLDDQLQQGEEY